MKQHGIDQCLTGRDDREGLEGLLALLERSMIESLRIPSHLIVGATTATTKIAYEPHPWALELRTARYGYAVVTPSYVGQVIDDGYPHISIDPHRRVCVLLGDLIDQPVDSLWDQPERLLPAPRG